MAITGGSTRVHSTSLSAFDGANTYNTAVGELQGEKISKEDHQEVLDSYKDRSLLYWEQQNLAEYKNSSVEAYDGGAYSLKGKAGIKPNFYRAFSDAFDNYKGVIVKDLKKIQTNPNITQAFKGTQIEKAIKNLIIAVEAEANDYLFSLERKEKTVIEHVRQAFERQQSSMGHSMQSDTNKLTKDNSTASGRQGFIDNSREWYYRGLTSNN